MKAFFLAIMFFASLSLSPNTALAQACNAGEPGYLRIRNTITNAENFVIDDIGCVFGGAVDLLMLVVMIASVIWIIFSGIQYTSASGNPDKQAAAKTSLIWAVIGLIVSFSALAIIRFIQAFLA
jgi:small-conductance mechanosensitive channel